MLRRFPGHWEPATLVEDAPLPGTASLQDLEWKGVPEARFKAFCEGLGLKSLQRRPKRWAA